ncbi:MAG: hypothetical protein JWM21_854 [Acidobacteria bacterium]|nr:hypothetical protein [Acidobacteriota bacterium]
MTELENENLIRRFLLGELSHGERERVEERLFTDEEFLIQVDAIEDELMDEYRQGRLGARESDGFKQYFLVTHERRERFEFAQIFQQALAESETSRARASSARRAKGDTSTFWIFRRRALAISFAIGLLLFASVAMLFWYRIYLGRRSEDLAYSARPSPNANKDQEDQTGKDGRRSPPNKNENRPADKDRVTNELRILQKPKAGGRQLSQLAIVLAPGAARGEGEGVKRFSLPGYAKSIRLELILENEDEQKGATFEADLQSADSKSLLKAASLRASSTRNGGRLVRFNVPKERLPAGDYQVVLRALGPEPENEMTSRYYFRVLDSPEKRRSN